MGTAILITIVIIGVLVMIGLALALVTLKKKPRGEVREDAWPFIAKPPLTPSMQMLYTRLVDALPAHRVLAQVALPHLLAVKSGHSLQAWLNRIDRLSADFVVCHHDGSIAAVIELEDDSHQVSVVQDAAHRRHRALTAAGIKIIHWRMDALPDTATIQQMFRQ